MSSDSDLKQAVRDLPTGTLTDARIKLILEAAEAADTTRAAGIDEATDVNKTAGAADHAKAAGAADVTKAAEAPQATQAAEPAQAANVARTPDGTDMPTPRRGLSPHRIRSAALAFTAVAAAVIVAGGVIWTVGTGRFGRTSTQPASPTNASASKLVPDTLNPEDFSISFDPTDSHQGIKAFGGKPLNPNSVVLDVSINRWNPTQVPHEGVLIIPTTTNPKVEVGLLALKGPLGGQGKQTPVSDAMNQYLRSHGLSTLTGNDVGTWMNPKQVNPHTGTLTSPSAILVVNPTAQVDPMNIRLAIVDIESKDTLSGTSWTVKWGKIIAPGLDTPQFRQAATADLTHESGTSAKVANLRVLWSEHIKTAGYAIVSFRQNGTDKVAAIVGEDNGGVWKITNAEVAPGFAAAKQTGTQIFHLGLGGPSPDGGSFLLTGGLVLNPHIALVRLTYPGGKVVKLPVTNGVFGDVNLQPGTSVSGPSSVEAYNADGQLVK